MLTRCPCCGSTVDRGALLVSLEHNTIRYGDQTLQVGPQQGGSDWRQAVEFVYAVNRAWPNVAPYNDIIAGLWGAHEPQNVMSCIKHKACSARRLLRHFNIELRNVNRRGYQMVMHAR